MCHFIKVIAPLCSKLGINRILKEVVEICIILFKININERYTEQRKLQEIRIRNNGERVRNVQAQ